MSLSDVLLMQGRRCGARGDWDGALSAAQSAILLDGWSRDCLLFLAEASAHTGNRARMEQCLSEAEKLQPDHPGTTTEVSRIRQLLPPAGNLRPADSANPVLTAPPSNKGENIIFLIGLPRSGTTLLQRILGGHAAIHTIAEPWIMLHLCYALKRQGIEAEYDASLARQGLDDFFLELPDGESSYLEALRNMAGGLYQQALSTSGKLRFLDKTPRYFYIIPELKKVFPRAKFVFLLRNPLAILASVLRSWFVGDASRLKASKHHYRDLFDGPSLLMSGIKELADDAIVLQYEGLVADPAATIEALCELTGLPFEPNMLDYGNQPKFKGRFGDQIGIVQHRTARPDSIDRWQDDLIDPQSNNLARQLLDHLGPDLLLQMGYSHAELHGALDQLTLEAMQQNLPINDVPIELRNRFANSLCDAGEEYFAQGKLDLATQTFLRATQMDPKNPRPLNDMSVMLWNANEKDQAAEYVAKALSLAPTDRTTVLNYGDVMESSGQLLSARAAYWNYTLSNPDDSEVMQRYLEMSADVINETVARGVQAQRLAVTEQNFAAFAYSKRSHFTQLVRHESQRAENIDDCNLKVYQDMLAYNFILDNFPEGSRLLDIGGGDSRIIRWLKDRYEFWNLDKLEGLGNGLTNLDSTSGFRLVRDYIGAFSKELPDKYFDGIFSISTLEHVPEDEATLKAICADMNRVLKPGGLSIHCFDVLVKQDGFWIHRLVDHLHANEPVSYPRAPDWKMRLDPDLWGMTLQGYNRTWLPVTKKAYEKFGMPISYNVMWRKADAGH